jgi:predicted O-methyltransferase YrrM
MDNSTWTAVDEYFSDLLLPDDDALEAALRQSAAGGLPTISVSPLQGSLLHILARMIKARRVLEIGTLGAYSTIWLARALPPGGRVVSLELDPHHAQVAKANLDRAGLGAVVEIRVGPASESLQELETLQKLEETEPYDLFFIDADKRSIPEYLESALRLSRPGSVIVIDNVVRNGAVVDASMTDADMEGIRRAAKMLGEDPRLCSTVIQTVGLKGYDGFALAVVKG